MNNPVPVDNKTNYIPENLKSDITQNLNWEKPTEFVIITKCRPFDVVPHTFSPASKSMFSFTKMFSTYLGKSFDMLFEENCTPRSVMFLQRWSSSITFDVKLTVVICLTRDHHVFFHGIVQRYAWRKIHVFQQQNFR